MPTFCTITSLDTIMVGTAFNTATTALADKSIANAENKIREILSSRYDVSSAAFQTSTSTPPVVSTICEWLSVGYMYENLSRGGKDAFNRADRYIDKAMDNMKAIIEYKANIVDSTGSIISEGANSTPLLSNTTDYHDTFAEDDPLKWTIDKDKLDDISDDRDI